MGTPTVSQATFWRIPLTGVFVILVVISLTFLGLVVLFSASKSMGTDPTLLLRKQLIWLVVALIACGITMSVNLTALRDYVYWLAGFIVITFARPRDTRWRLLLDQSAHFEHLEHQQYIKTLCTILITQNLKSIVFYCM